jgi:hypothetical protein
MKSNSSLEMAGEVVHKFEMGASALRHGVDLLLGISPVWSFHLR